MPRVPYQVWAEDLEPVDDIELEVMIESELSLLTWMKWTREIPTAPQGQFLSAEDLARFARER